MHHSFSTTPDDFDYCRTTAYPGGGLAWSQCENRGTPMSKGAIRVHDSRRRHRDVHSVGGCGATGGETDRTHADGERQTDG